MEELLARHRKEARDLQSRVTQKKKQASKKTRKGVNDECDQLESDLRRRQAEEVAALQGGDGGDAGGDEAEDASRRLQDLTSQIDGDDSDDDAEQGEASTGKPFASSEDATNAPAAAISGGPSKKPNRAKARLARRAAEQEELVRQAKEEAQNLPDMKALERERMLSAMTERGLAEKVIRADGHCLYSAFVDQLEQLDMPLEGGGGGGGDSTAKASSGSDLAAYKIVRATAARYIEQHEDDFLPFLEEPLPEYLHKIRDTGEWGGQLELMALAKTYGVDINILQDFGRVEKIEGGQQDADKDDGRTMWLGYYKHGFGLGEHYNSLRRKATS
jgi:OTU domain-containing protein 6